ncbi:hypothetical protein FOL47_006324 [Perkinsus chesapeaki]|uniref:Chromatin associated protein KTI12 n=1 Tax=Perkinsus chesapeaki TaxID=330153 RepID=A0A7J6LSM1_PERCH|nr:hypothetical protein FOL47_006324 [Perkinsus chesapeaki]
MPSNVVVILCGLPASGKSTLSEKLKSQRADTYLIEYDAIGRRLLRENGWGEQEFDPGLWREGRRVALQEMALVLRRSEGITVVMDDNQFLRSMRKSVCKAAWSVGAGVCCVFMNCPLEECLKRNAERSYVVPPGVITGMSEVLEVPEAGDGGKNGQIGWERRIPVVHISDCSTESLVEVDRAIGLARNRGVPEFSEHKEESVTVVEETETRMRRIVTRIIGQVTAPRKSEVAKSLSKMKIKFMSEVKHDPNVANDAVNEFVQVAGELI